MQAALASVPAAAAADYLLITHDDTAMDPDCVTRLVEAAIGIPGLEDVGVVGPKVVDWYEPRLLREVGRSTDRFGHPYTPLRGDEEPLPIVGANAEWLELADGTKVIDAISSWWTILFGHRDPRLMRSLAAASRRVTTPVPAATSRTRSGRRAATRPAPMR